MSDIREYEEKMKKSVEALKEDYTTIRAGRANPHILDKIKRSEERRVRERV